LNQDDTSRQTKNVRSKKKKKRKKNDDRWAMKARMSWQKVNSTLPISREPLRVRMPFARIRPGANFINQFLPFFEGKIRHLQNIRVAKS
jgi:hypothetical protein